MPRQPIDYGIFEKAEMTVDEETRTGRVSIPLKDGIHVDIWGPIPALARYIADNPAGELLAAFNRKR